MSAFSYYLDSLSQSYFFEPCHYKIFQNIYIFWNRYEPYPIFDIEFIFSKYHRNVQDPLCCSLNKLKNHRVKINDILLITDQKLSDRELTCAVTHYKDHRPNMYIVERDPFADEVMTYRIHAEHNHTRVSFTRDRYTALPFVRGEQGICFYVINDINSTK